MKRHVQSDKAVAGDATVAERLGALGTTTLSDALESLGSRGECAGILSLGTGESRIAGPAVTVELAPVTEASAEPHLGAAAIEAARPGDVVVVANHGVIHIAAWGGLLSEAARLAGIAGIVIDGACRDVDEIARLGLAVFARATTPLTARGRITERATGSPVHLAGREVRMGDWIVGDASGVVVVPASLCEAALVAGERIAAVEEEMRAELLAGAPASRVLGTRYERMLQR